MKRISVWSWVLLGAGILVLLLVWQIVPSSVVPTPAQPPDVQEEDSSGGIPESMERTNTLIAQDIPNVAGVFQFEAVIPAGWRAEAVPSIEAIAIYDPTSPGATTLEKSQIFIRYFRGNTFLTLSTVNILNRKEITVNDRPAVRYEIEKKDSIPNFANQPLWRNARHSVTDIRISDGSPSLFYVIARRPDLSEQEYQRFLESIKVGKK